MPEKTFTLDQIGSATTGERTFSLEDVHVPQPKQRDTGLGMRLASDIGFDPHDLVDPLVEPAKALGHDVMQSSRDAMAGHSIKSQVDTGKALLDLGGLGMGVAGDLTGYNFLRGPASRLLGEIPSYKIEGGKGTAHLVEKPREQRNQEAGATIDTDAMFLPLVAHAPPEGLAARRDAGPLPGLFKEEVFKGRRDRREAARLLRGDQDPPGPPPGAPPAAERTFTPEEVGKPAPAAATPPAEPVAPPTGETPPTAGPEPVATPKKRVRKPTRLAENPDAIPQQIIMVGRERGELNARHLSESERQMMSDAGYEPDADGYYSIDPYDEGMRRLKAGTWDTRMSAYDNSHLQQRAEGAAPAGEERTFSLDEVAESPHPAQGETPHDRPLAQTPEDLNASTAGHSLGAPRPDARRLGEGEEIQPLEKGLYDMARAFNQALGLTHRQGRYKGTALGIYKVKPAVVRTKAMHEMNTLAHEGGHHLDFLKLPTLTAVKTRHAGTLGDIADKFYGGGGRFEPNDPLRPIEGWAEFWRFYVTSPEDAKRMAPTLFADVETALGKDRPDLLAQMHELQAHYQEYLKAPGATLVMSHIVDATPPSTLAKVMDAVQTIGKGRITPKALATFGKQIADEVYTSLIDRFNPMKQAVEQLMQIAEERGGKRFGLEVHQDPYKLLRMSPGARAAGHMDIRYGVHGYHTIEPTGPSLADAISLALAPADHESLSEWTAAKEAVDAEFQEAMEAKRAGIGHNGGPAIDDPNDRPDYGELPYAPEGRWNKQRYDEFSAYLHARNMAAQWARYRRGERELPPDGNIFGGPTAYESTIKDLEARNPHWRHAADMVHQYAQNLWDLRRDAGFITDQEHFNGLVQHPDYMPANRLMTNPGDELLGGRNTPLGRQTGGTGKSAGGVKQQRGSTRAVIDPLWSLAQQSYELRTLIARNDAIRALIEVANRIGEGGGEIIEKVPAHKLKAQKIDVLEALRAAAEQHGLSERDEIELEQAVELITNVFGEDVSAKVFRATESGEHGENFVYHWKNGEQEMWQLPSNRLGRQLLGSIANMNRPMQSTWVNIAAQPARILRLGVTMHPKFFIANIMGDQPTVMSLEAGYVPYLDWARGLREELRPAKTADVSRRYNAMMGAVGGMQTAAERDMLRRRSIQALIGKGFTIHELPEKAAAVSEFSETGTRLGLFMKAEKEAKGRGLGDREAAMEGSYKARDILDFDLRGAAPAMQGLLRMVPFLNANLQALSKAGKTAFSPRAIDYLLGKRPRTPQEAAEAKQAMWTWVSMTGMAAISLGIRAHYGDDPEYAEVADYLRSSNWVFKIKKGEYLVIKKPYEMGALSDIAESVYEALALHDKTALGRGAEQALQLLTPSVIAPPLLDIPFRLAANKDQFGQPIVPDNLKKVEPRDQETEYSNIIAKAVGHAMNWSPAKLDYTMRSATGHWGGDLLKGVDKAFGRQPEIADDRPDMFFVARFDRDVTRGSRSAKTFWTEVENLTRKEDSLRLRMMDHSREKEALEMFKGMTKPERGWAMVNLFGRGQEKEIHPLYHAQKEYVEIAGLAHDLQTGEVIDPHTRKAIPLTPRQRKDAVDALHYLNMAQVHNALIDMGEPGYERAKRLDRTESLAKLHAVSPALSLQLEMRYAAKRIPPVSETRKYWRAYRSRYEDVSEGQLRAMIEVKRDTGRDSVTRVLRQKATQP